MSFKESLAEYGFWAVVIFFCYKKLFLGYDFRKQLFLQEVLLSGLCSTAKFHFGGDKFESLVSQDFHSRQSHVFHLIRAFKGIN